LLSLLSSTKAIRHRGTPVSIGQKLMEIETERTEFLQTKDWGGDILGLVDASDYVKDVKSSLEEQEVNYTYE